MKPNELIARAWEHTRDGFNALVRDPGGNDNARTARAVACEALHAVEDLVYALGQERGIVFPDQGSVGPPRSSPTPPNFEPLNGRPSARREGITSVRHFIQRANRSPDLGVVATCAIAAIDDLADVVERLKKDNDVLHRQLAQGSPILIDAARALTLADAVRVYLRRCMGAIPLDRLPPDDPVLALRDALADFEAGAQPSGPPRLRVHTVSEGESLSGIAYMYGITQGRSYSYLVLADLNRIADPEHIEPGWKIIIPD